MSSGPLHGVRVVELAGIGPAPFAAMVLSDLGAEVIRVDRFDRVGTDETSARYDVLARGRRCIAINLKERAGIDALLRLIASADALVEGFRPGVTERLGIGPEVCLGLRPSLVYGRMTGWGQQGPLSSAAGHDINYISLAGALDPIGMPGGPPVVPLNFVGDFGGGGMLLALGVVCALFEARGSGKGQVVDAAMVDGAALLSAIFYGLTASGRWHEGRGSNLLDGGAHMYGVYETADHKYVSIGSLEPQFYAILLEKLGLSISEAPQDENRWPELRDKFAAIFRTKTRDQWCEMMEGTDVCFAPVLSMSEAADHPHNQQRQTFVEFDGVRHPSPAPRFSRTPGEIAGPALPAGHDTEAVLSDAGFSDEEIAILRSEQVIA